MARAQGSEAHSTAGPHIPPNAIEAARRRLQLVRANLRFPDRPFADPTAAHDACFRALGLLLFVRLDLPSPDPDLVAELIANYSYYSGRSSVRGRHIEVSLKSFAEALFLPAKSPYLTPASDSVFRAAVASAAKEFTKVYIQPSMEAAADGGKRRVPVIVRLDLESVEDDRPDFVNWTSLLWELLKEEMEHLVQSESHRVSYYGAYLHRLICVQLPELFQLPPEPSMADPPAASPKKPVTDRSVVSCSEFDMHIIEARSKQIELASKKIDLDHKTSLPHPRRLIWHPKSSWRMHGQLRTIRRNQ